MINTFLLMGRPGSGKGTQAHFLVEKLGTKFFSLGVAFREMATEPTYFGQRFKEVLDRGDLAPDWLAKYVFQHALLELGPSDKIVSEGGCRKRPEAELFDEVASWLGRSYVVFNIVITDETVLKRVRGRDTRADDDPQVIPNRLKRYKEVTEPSIAFFREKGKVIDIDGEQTPEEVHRDILKALEIVT